MQGGPVSKKGNARQFLGVGVWYNPPMKPLSETNPFIRDPETRRRMLEENAYASSVFEGARGLPQPAPRPRRARASAKKSVKGS